MHDEENDSLISKRPKSKSLALRNLVTQENWKRTLYAGSLLAIFVLFFNLGFVLWAAQHQLRNGDRTLFIGDCQKSKTISTGLHLVINILGTLLLGASNYGMQCLCAPSRKDIDLSHGKTDWLDIGVQSLRNLSRIPGWKACLWFGLALSSLPLHLVYNATIFQAMAVYGYDVFIGSKPFSSFESDSMRPPNFTDYRYEISFNRLQEMGIKGELEQIEPSECLSRYDSIFQPEYGSVLLISDSYNSTITDYDVVCPVNVEKISFPYFVGDSIDAKICHVAVRQDPGASTAFRRKVEYCLVERVPQKCTLEYSLPLAIVIIVANLIKAGILCLTAIFLKETPILTTGDAVASFTKKADPNTRGLCLLSRDTARDTDRERWRFSNTPKRLGSAVSGIQWIACLLSYSIAIGVCVGLLCLGFSAIPAFRSAWAIGLGEIKQSTMIDARNFPTSLLANTIIANTPQAIFSILYFASNTIYTTMTLAAEWNGYSLQRKGLRVSTTPQGSQRNTYFLSLPYRYSIPLLIFSALLHWLISQSLFPVAIRAYSSALTRDPFYDIMTCGYSPVGITSSLLVGGVMVICLILLACRRFKSGMPVAGSCSLAISAACHRSSVFKKGDCETLEEQLGDETLPLKWGVEKGFEGRGGHCTFSSDEVCFPVHGCAYL